MASSRSDEAILLLEDGSLFVGRAVSPGTRFGEVVFNTAMSGYQEVLSDPSYRGQIVVMTQPHIGNYGVDSAVSESARPWVEGFVARRFTREPSNHTSETGIFDYLRSSSIPALDGIDTRAVVRRLRERGALKGVITSERSDIGGLLAELADFPSMAGRALVDEVTCSAERTLAAVGVERPRARFAVYDFGCKTNILRSLQELGIELVVVPAATPAERIRDLGVDAVVLSNGPGDPEPLTGIIAAVRDLVESGTPTFGICLGHQLLGLALGGRTFKLKFGHHGGNQPVVDLATRRVAITSQNHGFAVDPESLPAGCRATEVNLNDGTLEAFAVDGRPVLSVQYHPEAAPGPHDAHPLFRQFLDSIPALAASSRG
jgi:carbamoyl-phosphate synthase small subunit